jgi:galactitol PTS system EIIC component
MSTANQVIGKIIEIGPVVIIPAILFIIGFITTRNPLKNFLNSLYIFTGIIGISISLALFINFFKPLIETIVSASGKEFIVSDIGWEASKHVVFNSPVTLYIIIAVAALNLVMLFLRLTRTINFDLWNWIIFLFAGSIVFTVTEIMWLSVLVAAVISAITLVITDIYAPYLQTFYGLKAVSNPQTQLIIWTPIVQVVNIILNKIPFIRRAHIFYAEIKYRLGMFSEPMVLGFILGFAAGLVTRYRTLITAPKQDILFSLGMGLQLAVIMIIMPRFMTLLYRGLVPAINDISSFINRKITKRELHIGLDAVYFAGHPEVIGLSVIMIPLTVYIATVLPGNNILPSADLILIPFLLVWVIAPSGGDIFRSFISAAIIIPLTLWISSDMGNLFTSFFQKYGIEISGGAQAVSSYGTGSNWLFWILLQIIKPILNLFS